MLMVERLDDEFKRLGLRFKGLWGRKLHAVDRQGLTTKTKTGIWHKLKDLETLAKQKIHPRGIGLMNQRKFEAWGSSRLNPNLPFPASLTPFLSPVTSKPASWGRIKTGHSEVIYS